MLIWQIAVMLDSRRIIGMCENPDRYDEQINSWYEMALSDKDEKIQHYAADSLFGFYLRKKNYEMAEKYLNYFSDYDPMKKVKQGQLYMKQGKKEEAFEMLEKAVFSEYTTLNLAFGIMITKALEEKDHGYARFLAEKMCTLASGFDMGKYNEYAELIDTMEQIKKAGKLPIIFADKDSWTIHQGWDAIDMSSRGSQDDLFQKVLNGDAFLYEDPIALDSTRKFLEIRKYGQKQTVNTGYDEAVKRFAKGEAYMFLQGNWAYPMIKKINPDIDLLFMPFPADDEDGAKVVAKIDATLGISASCEHLDAIGKFLDYVFSKNISEYYAEKAGAYSCIKFVDVTDSYAKAFTDSISNGDFYLEEFAYESTKSDARNTLFQNFISSTQRNTEKSFLKKLNDLLIQ